MDIKSSTITHRDSVVASIQRIVQNLQNRAWGHDIDKITNPVLHQGLDETTSKDYFFYYGSAQHNEVRERLYPLLKEHYAVAKHHPEHYENGILGMSLMDLIEMLVDWKSANASHDTITFQESLAVQKERFNIPEPLYQIILNTVREMEW